MRHRIIFDSAAAVASLFGTTAAGYGFAMSSLVPGAPGEAYFQEQSGAAGAFCPSPPLWRILHCRWLGKRALQNPVIRLRTATGCSVASAAFRLIVFAVVGALADVR